MAEDLNPRWVNYCRAHGRTSTEQLAHDAAEFPGGKMTGFLLWHRARIQEAYKAIPDAFTFGGITNHETYDAWLTAWVDKALEN